MARGSKASPPPQQPAVLRIPREDARAQIQKQIDGGRGLTATPTNALRPAPSEQDYNRWSDFNRELLLRIFTADDYVKEYDFVHFSEPGGTVAYGPSFRSGPSPTTWQAKVAPRIACLQSILERLSLIDAPPDDAVPGGTGNTVPGPRGRNVAPAPLSKEVFVVHGHDGPAKAAVVLVLERAGLQPVILHEQPNSGRTIIEKFEQHGAAADFAVILLTPDDVGGKPGLLIENLSPRARQNVIAEMGWFAGKLGRSRVCVLKKGDVEVPSDFAGVGYTEMDDRGAWKIELLRELAAAGYELNWPKALA